MPIDLRSDTVTRPTPAMREAMHKAPVGDDVFGDDPSINAFQEAVAARAGYPAALFFPTGTQSNLAALMSHCQRGDEFIAGQNAHLYKYEAGGAAVLGSIQPQPIQHEEDGTLSLDRIAAAIKQDDFHYACTRLVALENTFHGRVIPQKYLNEVTAFAADRGLATHLDGARLFNASVATGLPLSSLCNGFESVSLCFSKGLGAPVGSVLVGSDEFIATAKRIRKMLGGGMRQAGILAAGCHYALDHHVQRLADDHCHARLLADGLRDGLAEVKGAEVLSCDTNMVFVRFPEQYCADLQTHMAAHDVLMAPSQKTRLVTHLDVSREDVQKILDVMAAFFRA
ncbi:low-specificity L-threonine aldolase [Marinobacter caseinilyticus]|uniref:low-specificity L-threonine aldolase n=1 Tax=Marinobacter caseinilyticus TaxID=2692195 RepID=UPI00140A2D62|nr:low-specificity L-threonine aldolase [Marinobacter caseinilyticus]